MTSQFTPDTFSWLNGITESNSREFFTQHKEQYARAVREPFEALLEELAQEFGGTPSVFRPNRDVRFSRDKSPYKTNISGYLAGRPGTAAAAYLQLSSECLMAATGYHEMAADQLERYRKVLTSDRAATLGAELRGLLAAATEAGCAVGGEQLKTAPRGVDREAENISLLRYKSLTAHASLSVEEAQHPQAALDFVRAAWRAGQGMCRWMDEHVGPSALPDRAA